MRIQIELPEEVLGQILDQIAERVISRLHDRGLLVGGKPWLRMPEAKELSGLSAWEIRKRIKAGTVEIHQPNPGKKPLLISPASLLSSMNN